MYGDAEDELPSARQPSSPEFHLIKREIHEYVGEVEGRLTLQLVELSKVVKALDRTVQDLTHNVGLFNGQLQVEQRRRSDIEEILRQRQEEETRSLKSENKELKNHGWEAKWRIGGAILAAILLLATQVIAAWIFKR